MSDLSSEVAAKVQQSQGLTWFQRASLIVFANIVGLVLGAIVISAGGIIWSKAMSTDTIRAAQVEGDLAIRKELQGHMSMVRAERDTILSAVANMKAEQIKALQTVAAPAVIGEEPAEPPLPEAAPPASEPSAADVQAERDAIQQKIDEALYRERQQRK